MYKKEIEMKNGKYETALKNRNFILFNSIMEREPDFEWTFGGDQESQPAEACYGEFLEKNYISKTTMELSSSFKQN